MGQIAKMCSQIASLFHHQSPRSGNSVTPTAPPLPKQNGAKDVYAYDKNARHRLFANKHPQFEKRPQVETRTFRAIPPAFIGQPTTGGQLRLAAHSGETGRVAPFQLDFRRMNAPSLNGLPPHLQQVRFDSNLHALCFIKAAVARNYRNAEAIALSRNSQEWRSLSTGLRGLHEQTWEDQGKYFFKDKIVAHKQVVQPQPNRPRPAPSLTLDMTKMGSRALRMLPAHLQRPRFHDDYHAQCFIKAALAGSRTGDYRQAEAILNAHDRGQWESLSARLEGFVWTEWENGGRDHFKAQIKRQMSPSGSAQPRFSQHIARTSEQALGEPNNKRLIQTAPNARRHEPSLELNLAEMGLTLPAHLQQLRFHDLDHAQRFIKAAVVAGRTNNYRQAEAILNAHTPDQWKKLSRHLEGYHLVKTDWENGLSDHFTKEINKQRLRLQSESADPSFSHRIARTWDQVRSDPHKDVPRLSATLAQVETNRGPVTCFYDTDSPLSNWYPCKFKDEHGIEYNCMEQYLFAQKFRLLELWGPYNEVMAAPNAAEQKKVNDKYKLTPQQRDLWQRGGQDEVLWKGSWLKFSQNPELFKLLLLTKGPLLEAAGPDHIYGTGAAVTNGHGMDAIKNSTWTGLNKLGNTLTNLRDHPQYAGQKQNLDMLRSQYRPQMFS